MFRGLERTQLGQPGTRDERHAEVELIYDGDCPVCSNYVLSTRIRRDVGVLKLVNARDHPAVVSELRSDGMDIDSGIVLRVGASTYYGAAAMQTLAMMATPSTIVNRTLHWIFRNPTRARRFYPPLTVGRRLLLWLLGRKPIQTEPEQTQSD